MTRLKESGIDWIGQIPEEWEMSKIRYLVATRSEKRITDSSVPYIGLENIESQTGKFVKTGIQVDKSENIVVEIGDVLFGKLRPYLRKYWRATFTSTASSEFLVFQSSELDMNFLYYAIQSDSFIEEVNTSTYGSKMPRASWEYIKNMRIAFPTSLVEQQKIADFLDKKTAQLDKAKNLLEEQIQKLKDYRASLIYETVTKGLDKNVPMKDSGIDWIGEVPQGWGVKRLKDYVDFQTGTTPPQSIGVNQERKGVRWFKPGDFSDESVDLTSAENYITSEVVIQQKLSVYPEKTILVVGIASIGKVGYSENHSYSNQQITALKVTGQIFPKYLAYLMFSSGQYIRETALYTIVPIINNQYLSSLKIVLPNRVVQETIVEYLDKKIGQINKMIVIKNEQIKNINKQRQTLIYDYVTGKRRV